MRQIYACFSALFMSAACTGCAGKAAAAKATPPPTAVQTITARQGSISPSIQLAGVIAPYRQVAVTANLSEPLSEVDVVEGQRVRAGQVLARQLTDDLQAQLVSSERVVGEDAARLSQTLYTAVATTAQNSTTVTAATEALHEAQTNLSGAQTDLKRYQSLASQGYLPAQTLDQQRVVVATDLQAVAAAVIGGTALSGGIGNVLGAVVGALLIRVIDNGLVLTQVDANWFKFAVGSLTIFAVVANAWMRRTARHLKVQL